MRPGYGKKKPKNFNKKKKKAKAAAAAGDEVDMQDAAGAPGTTTVDEKGATAAPTSTPRATPSGTPEAAAIAHALAVNKAQGGTAKERLRAKLQLKRALRVKNLKPGKKKGKGLR
jgi:hypothetical protein